MSGIIDSNSSSNYPMFHELVDYGVMHRECESLPFKNSKVLDYRTIKHQFDLKTKMPVKQKVLEKLFAPIEPTKPLRWDYTKLTDEKLVEQYTRDYSDKNASFIGSHTVFTAADRGSRSRMEDTSATTLLQIKVGSDIIEIPTFMVFDGHGGTAKSCKCSEFLAFKFESILKKKFKGVDLNNYTEVKHVLKAAFLEADAIFRKKYVHDASGSTAIVAFVLNNMLWVANAGDSRAVLSVGDRTVQLSEDANCAEEPFKASIIKRGGNPKYYYYEYKTDAVGRYCLNEDGDLIRTGLLNCETNPYEHLNSDARDINGNKVMLPVYSRFEKPFVNSSGIKQVMHLAPGRTIGDRQFPEVTARPQVKTFDLSRVKPEEDAYLIIACDGVWDVLGSEEVSAIVQKTGVLFQEKDNQVRAVAKKIMREAFKRDTFDNITVMAIKLSIPCAVL